MRIFPAIDIQRGRCVRLLQGRAEDETVYGDPVEMALRWRDQGARRLHVVDLDGAFSGAGANLDRIGAMVRQTGLPIQLGGGIRTMDDIRQRLEELGVWRVILGTAAVENPALVERACTAYPGRIALGLDARDGRVAVKGWVEDSGLEAASLALRMRELGVDTVIYTDIARDGMLGGVNVAASARLQQQTGLQVVASGGVGSLEDLQRLGENGLYGAILGKALYAGRIALGEALKWEEEEDV